MGAKIVEATVIIHLKSSQKCDDCGNRFSINAM